MVNTNKKRKVSDAGTVSVKAEPGVAAVLAPPPEPFHLSPIQKILSVDLWKEDSNAVETALLQLADLCLCSNVEFEENRATVHRLGGAAILPGVLRKWYKFPLIQAEGCRALMNSTCSDNNAAFRKSAKESGGLDAIIWAIKSYPDELDVQTYACGALGNVVYGLKGNAEYAINTLNGSDWIIAAMKKFPHDAKLQRYACGTLNILTEWDEFKDSVKQAGGRRALLDAIENHQDESKEHVKIMQMKAKSALKKLL